MYERQEKKNHKIVTQYQVDIKLAVDIVTTKTLNNSKIEIEIGTDWTIKGIKG